MARSWYSGNPRDFDIGARSEIQELGLVHEPDAPTSGHVRTPYVACYLLVDVKSGLPEALGNTGALRLSVEYTDGTRTTLVENLTPFSGYTIPTSPSWVVVKENGQVANYSGTPTSSAVPNPTDSSNTASNERFAIDASKTVNFVLTEWASNA